MRLRREELSEAADEHAALMAGQDWNGGPGSGDEVAEALASATAARTLAPDPPTCVQHGQPDWGPPEEPPPIRGLSELLGKMDELTEIRRTLQELADKLTPPTPVTPREDGPVPRWLLDAAGDPALFDTRDPTRRGVGWRVAPATIRKVKQVQTALGLRTLAGTLECVLRLGCAAAARLRAR